MAKAKKPQPKNEVPKSCFSLSIKKTKDKDFPFNLVLKQRKEVMFEIPCVGEYACNCVADHLRNATKEWEEKKT